jgi:NADH dehydrogenase
MIVVFQLSFFDAGAHSLPNNKGSHAKITFCTCVQDWIMRVAVIGGTGFVGGYLVDALLESGHEPALLVRAGSEAKVRRADACRITTGELSSAAAVKAALNGCDAVIYNVGILRENRRQGITFEALHFDGAVRVIDAARKAGIRRFLLMSANGLRRPGTPYQEYKLRAEEYVEASGLDFTIMRPSVIFGDPRGNMEIATQLYRDMIRLPFPAVGFHTGMRPAKGPVLMAPVHVRDVAGAFVKSLHDESTFGRCYELGGPDVLSWTEMLRRIAAAVDKKKIILPMPIGLMKVGATLFDWLPFFPVTRDQLTMLAQGNVAEPGELRVLIGREPAVFTAANLGYLKDAEA